jgi:hypothetical protein
MTACNHKVTTVCPRNLSNILRNFPCGQPEYRGAPGSIRPFWERRANAQYAALSGFVAEFPRAKAPERLNSLKILYWRFRDSANLSKNSVPDFQPRGRGSYYEALCLRCQLLLQDSQLSLHPLATVTLPADLFVIADTRRQRNPLLKLFAACQAAYC